MKKSIKEALKKHLKADGSHLGTAKNFFLNTFKNEDWEMYADFVLEEMSKKYNSIK